MDVKLITRARTFVCSPERRQRDPHDLDHLYDLDSPHDRKDDMAHQSHELTERQRDKNKRERQGRERVLVRLWDTAGSRPQTVTGRYGATGAAGTWRVDGGGCSSGPARTSRAEVVQDVPDVLACRRGS